VLMPGALRSLQNVIPLGEGEVDTPQDPETQLQEQEKRIEISCALAAEASRRGRMLSGKARGRHGGWEPASPAGLGTAGSVTRRAGRSGEGRTGWMQDGLMGWAGSKNEGPMRAGERAASLLEQSIPAQWESRPGDACGARGAFPCDSAEHRRTERPLHPGAGCSTSHTSVGLVAVG